MLVLFGGLQKFPTFFPSQKFAQFKKKQYLCKKFYNYVKKNYFCIDVIYDTIHNNVRFQQ